MAARQTTCKVASPFNDNPNLDFPPDQADELHPMLPSDMENDSSPQQRTSQAVGATISINRKAHTIQSMCTAYDVKPYDDKTGTIGQTVQDFARDRVRCSGECFKTHLQRFFPFVGVFTAYKWRDWLIGDIVSGVSVGVIHIPQGMGFAMLTSVPPVFGLYSSFFPVLLYFFFASSRHNSLGTMAVISIMIGTVVDREVAMVMSRGGPSSLAEAGGGNVTNGTADGAADDTRKEQLQIDLALSISLIVGILQILMGVLNLGIVASFMSMSFVASFLAGAAVHIITSQVPGVLGLHGLQRHSGVFKVPMSWYEIFKNIADTNVCAAVTGLLCLTVLIVLKEIINERFKARLKVPIPAELIVVVVGTLLSYLVDLTGKYELKVVGFVPKGIPPPRLPPMTNFTTYLSDCVFIAIISFAISVTMGKLMAKKHKYHLDVNQELKAYGIAHSVGACFNSFAGAQAPPRTLVHDSVGGQTQLGSLVSCVLILLVLLVIGPLFQTLPISVLASVIIVALLPLFKQFKDLAHMGQVNKTDLAVWTITFVSVIVLDIIHGLFIGVGVSVFCIALQGHIANGDALVAVGQSEIYLPRTDIAKETSSPTENSGVKVFRFQAPIFFANVEKFKQQLLSQIDKDGNANSETKSDSTHTLVLDCSFVSYIDMMGVNTLKELARDFSKVGVSLYLASCNRALVHKLSAVDALCQTTEESRSAEKAERIKVFPLVQDAVANAVAAKLHVTVL